MPDLVQMVSLKHGSTRKMTMVLYIVIGFGMFGTFLMMTAERAESLGLRPRARVVDSCLVGVDPVPHPGRSNDPAHGKASLSNVATVTLTVNGLNDAPYAAANFYETDRNTPLTVGGTGGRPSICSATTTSRSLGWSCSPCDRRWCLSVHMLKA